MPYFIWDESPSCSGWAVVKADGEEMSCHSNKQEAIEAMVGISVAEGIEPGGTYEAMSKVGAMEENELRDKCEDCDGNCGVCKEKRARVEDLEVGNYVQFISGDDVITGEIYAINGSRLEVKAVSYTHLTLPTNREV